jgi:outer membrane protein
MKKLTVLIGIVMLLTVGLFAQAQRIAIVNTERVMHEAIDTVEAQRLFQMDVQIWERQVMAIDEEINELERQLNIGRLTMSDAGINEAEDRLRQRLRDRQQLMEGIFGERGLATTRNHELLAPIFMKLEEILLSIAESDGYNMILDAAAGAVLWADPGLDITDRVILEMNRER